MYVLELKTVQSNAFRILIEALKEILTDANIEFDESGMKISTMDASHTVLVHLKLDNDKFCFYSCEKKITIGVNMLNFFKLIKTIGNSDTLTLFIESDNEEKLGIKIENGEKNSVTVYKLNLMDLNEQSLQVQPADFESIITMPSVEFQKIIRDMNVLADVVDIKSIGKQLMFGCRGDFASQETVIGEANSGMTFTTHSDNIVQGLFSLKYLVLFTKCTNLCQSIEIYLRNDYPLIIKYTVASLGAIKMCLAPQQPA